MCLGNNVNVGQQAWIDVRFFPDKGTLMITNLVKAFSHVLSEAAISSSFHDHNAHVNSENTHSTAQRQTLQMTSSEGVGFQIAGS